MTTENPKVPRVEQPTAAPAAPLAHDVERRTWEEFRATGLLWAANTVLQWFGWAIVVVTDDDTDPDKVIGAYPVRCKWRGFPADRNEIGISRLTAWMANAGDSLAQDIKEPEPDEPA